MKRMILLLLSWVLCCVPVAASAEPEYPVASEVVDRLRAAQWPDTAIAGVLGNMMAECGGQTLELQPCLYVKAGRDTYYGLCMWSLYYGPDVGGRDVEGQLDYLTETIAGNMKQFGGSLEKYLTIDDPGHAARHFCRYYERGAGLSQRARNAVKALAWIMEACK